MLGWSILRTGEGFSSAEAAFNKAIELEPALSSPRKGRAHLLWLAGRADAKHTACEELLDRLVREGREDPDSQVIRGWCLARLGRWRDAIVDYVRALPETRDDRAVIEFDLALCQLQVGRSDDAKGTLKQACSDLPPDRDPEKRPQYQPGLQRRGILAKIRQDLGVALTHGLELSARPPFDEVQGLLAKELQELPEIDAEPVTTLTAKDTPRVSGGQMNVHDSESRISRPPWAGDSWPTVLYPDFRSS